jgi:hypothetical protein
MDGRMPRYRSAEAREGIAKQTAQIGGAQIGPSESKTRYVLEHAAGGAVQMGAV